MADFNPFASLTDAVQSGLSDLGSGVQSGLSGIGNLFGIGSAQAGEAPSGGAPAPAPAAQPPGFQRPAGQSGTIMGFLDTLMGTPTSSQIAYENKEYQDRKALASAATDRTNQGAAMASIINFAKENPTMAPPQVLMNWIATPDGQKAFIAQGVDAKFMGDFIKQISPGAPVKLAEGDVLAQPGTTGLGSGQPATSTVPLYKNPKTLTPTELQTAYSHDEVLNAGDPKAAELGVNLKPGDSVIAKVYQDPTMTAPRVVDIKRNGPGTVVNMGDKAQEQNLKDQIATRKAIQTHQTSVLAAAKIGQRIIDLADSGDAKTGLVGVVARVGAGLQSQAKQLVQAASANGEGNVSLDPATYSANLKNLSKFITKTGVASEKVNSNIVALSYMLARARNGGQGLSNKDVAAQIDAMGSGWFTSPDQLRAGIVESVNAAIAESDGEVDINAPNYPKDGLVVPPQRTSDLIRKNGLNAFIANQSAKPDAKTGRVDYGNMSPTDLIKVDPKSVPAAQKPAYDAAMDRALEGTVKKPGAK